MGRERKREIMGEKEGKNSEKKRWRRVTGAPSKLFMICNRGKMSTDKKEKKERGRRRF